MKALKAIMETLSLKSKASDSQIYVSVNVTSTMRTSGLSRQSTREIIRVSVGSLLLLGLLFIVIYTILLAFVDNKLRPSRYDDGPWNYKKVRLVGKKMKALHSKDYLRQYEIGERKIAWNTTEFFRNEDLPHCEAKSVFRIIIPSSPTNRLRRQEIRSTWCKPQNFNVTQDRWQCVFVVSLSDDLKVNSMVKKESQIYNDILLGSFVDSYRNLTYKVIHGFDWFVSHCPSSFLVKTDDDCFVNGGVMLDFLLNHNKISSHLYAGNFVTEKERLRVIRWQGSKWHVPHEDFPNDHYPPYASGIGYILSLDSIKQFVRETPFIKPISNEDAYVGIVMSHLGIQPTMSSRFLLSASGLNVCNFLYVMITHDVEAEKQKELMQTSVKSKSQCNNVDAVQTWS